MTARILLGLLALTGVTWPSRAQSPFGGAGRDTTPAPPEPTVKLRGPVLADSDVVAAIEYGKATKHKGAFWYRGEANCNKFGDMLGDNDAMWRVFTVVAQGPYGRIVDAAASATRKYMPFATEQVTPEMRAPTITVGVQQQVEKVSNIVYPVEHVIIRGVNDRGDPGPPVQPIQKQDLSSTYQNALGAKIETKGLMATFDAKSLPPGELQILVIIEKRECHATVHPDDRVKIQ
jgi:hypothetical protein